MNAEELVEQAIAELAVEPVSELPLEDLGVLLQSFDAMPEAAIASIAFHGNVVRRLKSWIALELMSTEAAPDGLPAPVVIVGLPRTGSTLLHNLLSLADGSAFLTHRDLVHPWWRLEGTDEALSVAEADVQSRLELMDLIGSGIRDAHPLSADWPDECTALFESTFVGYQWPITYGLPDYLRWLRALPATQIRAAYERYRRWLALLIAPPDASFMILKSPFHVLHLDSLRAVLPGVQLIQTVRHTREVLPSWMGLVDATCSAMFGEVPDQVRLEWTRELGRMAEASLVVAGDTIVVPYDRLVADPYGTVERILGEVGLPFSEPHRGRMAEWLRAPEQLRRAPHGSSEVLPRMEPGVADQFRRYDDAFGLSP